jgi:hypothetical protein
MRFTLAILFALFVLTLRASAIELRVSPGGPTPTLTAARDTIRDWRATNNQSRNQPIHVIIAAGTYLITEPLVFEPQDGGTESAPVTYSAASGPRPIITGGRRITGWKQNADGLWSTTVPEVKAGQWHFQDLWINGRRATRARTPNTRYLHAIRPALENYPGAPPMAKPEFSALYVKPENISVLSSLSPDECADAEVVIFQTWQIARHRIAFLDAKPGYMQFTAPSRWPFLLYEPRQRYILENFKGALDAPGEWFLSRDGTLFYLPLPGEDMTKAEVIAPVADTLVAIKGDPANGKFVEHLHFSGLSFQHTRFELGKEGHIDSQADSKIAAAVMLDGARHVEFTHCEIAHVATYGLWLRKGCTDNLIQHCYIHELGAGGVRIGETSVDPNPLARTHRNRVDDCIIHTGGRYFMGSVGVFIAHSGENHVTHNDIADFFYTGVSVGWVWGYTESLAHHNHIDDNHIHHLGYGVLSDMGGFYGLGPASGTTVSRNHIHHVNGYRYGGWGLYTDEGSSGVLMEDNLVHDTRHATFHQHYGKDNIIRNNIFAFGEEAQIQRSRSEEHLSFTYSNNIVIFNSGTLQYGQWNKPKVRMEQNLYWHTAEEPIHFGGKSFGEWQKDGYDAGSRVADPLFEDAAKRDFRLKANSPAFDVGFKPFRRDIVGVYGDDEWRILAASLKPLELEREEIPRFVLHDDFESTPVGKPIWNGHLSQDEAKGATIAVSEEQARGGKRSLKFQDQPGLSKRYHPHLSFDLNHKTGITKVTFDLFMQEGSEFIHEWRDKSAPYLSGPSIEIRKGLLKANGEELARIPPDGWTHFEMSARLGAHSDGKWSLVITLPDGSQQKHATLRNKNSDWRELESMVFVSDANARTALHIDNLDISHE